MNFKQAIREAGTTAYEKGWWEQPPSFGEFIALCHSELSEALEEYRNGKKVDETYFNRNTDGSINYKPEGIPTELADCIIRIFDYCHNMGIDIETAVEEKMEYNRNRSYKHGGKVL